MAGLPITLGALSIWRDNGRRVGLIGCGASKLDHAAAAHELYTSPYFAACKEWIRRSCDRWAILSAKHGVLLPDELVEPYDLDLSALPWPDYLMWCDRVRAQLRMLWGDEAIYRALAGDRYRGALTGEGAPTFVEDVIGGWIRIDRARRKDEGKRPRRWGIGRILAKVRAENADARAHGWGPADWDAAWTDACEPAGCRPGGR